MTALDVVPLCEDFARMGYAVASISYRLGIANLLDLENELIRAVWRGVHDGRAAVRYFRKSVEEDGNPWGIDPDRIYMGGVSAGGFLAVHHAYVDDEAEIPAIIDQSQPGMGGGLEGESGNPGYSSQVAGIFNVSGALKDAELDPARRCEPLVSVHGTADGTVPYGTGSVSLSRLQRHRSRRQRHPPRARRRNRAHPLLCHHRRRRARPPRHQCRRLRRDPLHGRGRTLLLDLRGLSRTSAAGTTTPATSASSSRQRCACTPTPPQVEKSPLFSPTQGVIGSRASGMPKAAKSPCTAVQDRSPPSMFEAFPLGCTSSM